MKKFCGIILLIFCFVASASVFAIEIVRDGEIIGIKDGRKWCHVFDWGQIDNVIPEGASNRLDVFTNFLNYKFVADERHAAVCGLSVTQFSKNFNFRKTANFIDDTDNNDFDVGEGILYGDAASGSGWVGELPVFRDRRKNVTPELAGVAHAINDGKQYTFRIDLPAIGTYEIRLAIGDVMYGKENIFVHVYDGETPIIRPMGDSGVTLAAGAFIDASGLHWKTPEAWLANNEPFIYESKTKILRIIIGAPNAIGGTSTFSNLSVIKVW